MDQVEVIRQKLLEAEQRQEERVNRCSVLRFKSEEEQQHNLEMIDYWQARQKVLRAELTTLKAERIQG